MNDRVKQVLNVILDKFKSGEIPKAVVLASFPMSDIPSSSWSFTNRILMFLSGTGDARGINQWRQKNRRLKKGCKAIYILVPCFKKEIDEETGEENNVLRFFKTAPVFRCEDTEGEPLDYHQIELPDLPLIEKAKEWGISVKAIPGNYRYRGYYSSESKEIVLATPEEKVFFHEISHAAHEKIKGDFKGGQDPLQEIIAELSAQALCRIVGRRLVDTTGNSHMYIESYAKKMSVTAHSACLKVLAETEKVLNLILKEDENLKQIAA